MARKWGKIISITALVVIVITGIVVGVLFAVGVLHVHKSGSTPSKPSPPGPTPPGPTVNCDQMPTITSLLRNSDGTYRMTFSPIAQPCTERYWLYYIYMDTGNNRGGETQTVFKPVAGQTFVDINLDLPFNQPWSPVKWATGNVYLRSDGANGPVYSNKFPYVITNI